MEKQHLIESAILKIDFPSEDVAFTHHGDMESFVRSRILDIVDEVFDEFSEQGQVLRIDTLEVNLGELTEAYFYQDFESKLRDKIRESLEAEIINHRINANSNVDVVSRNQSEFELICEFLQNGRVGWTANFNTSQSLESLLLAVTEHSGRELLEFVTRNPSRERLLSRIASQFSTAVTSQLLASWLSMNSDLLQKTVADILALSHYNWGSHDRDMEVAVWTALLRLSVSRSGKAGSNLQQAELVTLLIATLAGRMRIAKPVLLAAMLRQVAASSRFNYLLPALETLARSIELPLEAAGNSSDPEQEQLAGGEQAHESRRVRFSQLRAHLLAAVKTGESKALQPQWRSAISEFASLVKEVVHTEGQAVTVRRNIAYRFAEPMIRDIIVLLEPAHHEFIEDIVAKPKMLMAPESSSPIAEPQARRALWEFTLTYLLVERGSRFNRRSYVASVMRQSAAHGNLSLAELYNAIIAILQPTVAHDALREELLGFLIELRGELNSAKDRTRSGIDQSGEAAHSFAREDSGAAEEKDRDKSGAVIKPREAAVDAVRQALASGNVAALQTLWAELLTDYAPWLEKTLRVEARQLPVRQTMAQTFPDLMLKDIAELVEPVHGTFIYEAIRQESVIYRRPALPETRADSSRTVVWEFALAYLLVDRGSAFNKRSFLTGVVKQIAAHENLSIQSLFRAINLAIGATASYSPRHKELFSMLQEIGQELRLEAWAGESELESIQAAGRPSMGETRQADRNSVSQEKLAALRAEPGASGDQLELMRAYLLYEKLLTAISRTTAGEAGMSYQVVRLIHELLEQYPWKMHRLNQEVNSRRLSMHTVLAKLPKVLQRKIILAFFMSFSRHYSFSQKALEKYLDRMEAQQSNITLAYQALLETLIGHKVNSLEAIAAQLEKRLALPVAQQGSASEAAVGEFGDIADRSSSVSAKEMAASLDVSSARQIVRQTLQASASSQQQDQSSFVRAVETLLSADPRSLAMMLRDLLSNPANSDRLAALLPESLLVKVLILLRPADHFRAVLYADLMTMACVEQAAQFQKESAAFHLAKWQFIFDYLVVQGRPFNEVSFVRQFAEFLLQRSRVGQDSGKRQEFYRHLAVQVSAAASASTHVSAARINMILENTDSSKAVDDSQARPDSRSRQQEVDAELQELARLAEESAESTPFSFDAEEDDSDILEDIYIDNAGLVLLAPYLPRYFDMLGLTEARKFKDRHSAERAVHLLQYVLNESTDSFEYQLVLNKALCGVKAGIPIVKSIDITEKEIEATESMLKGVLANWPKLKNTSIAGLRETFLQREAHMQLQDDSWKLLVETKAFDILLDDVPWNFKTIKFPWMERAIYVDWR